MIVPIVHKICMTKLIPQDDETKNETRKHIEERRNMVEHGQKALILHVKNVYLSYHHLFILNPKSITNGNGNCIHAAEDLITLAKSSWPFISFQKSILRTNVNDLVH